MNTVLMGGGLLALIQFIVMLMAKAYYPTGNGSYTEWTPNMVGALGANFAGMSYKGYDGKTDWDKLTAGIYYIGQGPFSADLHQPVGAYPYGILLVFSNNGNNLTQVYIAHSDNQFWYRQRWSSSNSFCNWNRMITNIDIGSQSVNYANSSNYATKAGSADNEYCVMVQSAQPTDSRCKLWIKII